VPPQRHVAFAGAPRRRPWREKDADDQHYERDTRPAVRRVIERIRVGAPPGFPGSRGSVPPWGAWTAFRRIAAISESATLAVDAKAKALKAAVRT
jgi:hypothetical protein